MVLPAFVVNIEKPFGDDDGDGPRRELIMTETATGARVPFTIFLNQSLSPLGNVPALVRVTEPPAADGEPSVTSILDQLSQGPIPAVALEAFHSWCVRLGATLCGPFCPLPFVHGQAPRGGPTDEETAQATAAIHITGYLRPYLLLPRSRLPNVGFWKHLLRSKGEAEGEAEEAAAAAGEATWALASLLCSCMQAVQCALRHAPVGWDKEFTFVVRNTQEVLMLAASVAVCGPASRSLLHVLTERTPTVPAVAAVAASPHGAQLACLTLTRAADVCFNCVWPDKNRSFLVRVAGDMVAVYGMLCTLLVETFNSGDLLAARMCAGALTLVDFSYSRLPDGLPRRPANIVPILLQMGVDEAVHESHTVPEAGVALRRQWPLNDTEVRAVLDVYERAEAIQPAFARHLSIVLASTFAYLAHKDGAALYRGDSPALALMRDIVRVVVHAPYDTDSALTSRDHIIKDALPMWSNVAPAGLDTYEHLFKYLFSKHPEPEHKNQMCVMIVDALNGRVITDPDVAEPVLDLLVHHGLASSPSFQYLMPGPHIAPRFTGFVVAALLYWLRMSTETGRIVVSLRAWAPLVPRSHPSHSRISNILGTASRLAGHLSANFTYLDSEVASALRAC